MIKYFIHNGIAVTVLALAILLFGVLSLVTMPIQLTPDVQTPAITVQTFYPGATPQDVEQDIIVRQEEFLRGVNGLQKMTSTASLGQGEIILEFPVGFELSEALVRVSNALQQVPSYPENVDEPSLSTSSASDQPVAWFSIRAVPGREFEVDPRDHFDFAEDQVKVEFERIEGVASVQGVFGGSSKQMQIYLDPYKLSERGISIFDVRNAIRNTNRDVPGGDLEEGKRRYTVRTVGRYENADDAEETIIKVVNESPVYIRDVGYARLGTAEQRSVIRHNGRPALAMGVRHQPGTNLLKVMDRVKAKARELNEGALKNRGLFLTQVTDDTAYVIDSVAMVQNNLLIGGVLSVFILLLFLRHIRSTFIIAVAVPLSIMGSVFAVDLAGRTINVIMLAGLAFSIGAVLDNSIVVLENIFRHRQMGKEPGLAAYDGISEVWTAIFSSVVTNVVVFVPIINLQMEAGQLFRDLAIAITATNVFSFIVAVLIIPCLASKLLVKIPGTMTGEAESSNGLLRGIDQFGRWGYGLIESTLSWLMEGKVQRLGLVFGMGALAAMLIFIFMPQSEYLPEGNQNSVFAFMLPPQGYGLDEMSAIGRELENRFRPYVEGTVQDYEEGKLEGPPIRDFFFVSFNGGMFMFTRAKDPSTASQIPDLMNRIIGEVPGVIPITGQRSIFSQEITGSRAIELDVVGTDMVTATDIGAQAFGKVMQLGWQAPRPEPGVEVGQPELTIRPRWERAAELGISAQAIGYGAWVLGDGAYADDYYLKGKKYDLYLYSTLGAFDTLSNFETLRVANDRGDAVPLSSIADVNFNFVPEKIRRVDEQRAVTLNIVPPKDISLEKAIQDVRTQVVGSLQEEGAVPQGYSLRIGGSSDKLQAIRRALTGDVILAISLVYFVLVLIFHNWGYPLIILFSIPIGMTGGVLGLSFMNFYLGLITQNQIQSLDVLTMLGFIILLGSIVNNPILIVEQTLNFNRQGMDIHDAIVQATLSRVRPMLMTTGTTILGLSPLVFIPGPGTELYRGLGVVMFGGLLLGTFTIVFFIPSAMSLVIDLSAWLKRTTIGRTSSTAVRKLQEGG